MAVHIVSRRILPLAAAAAVVAVMLQGGASQAQTVAAKPTLKQLIAKANTLSNEVDELGQQYDALQIELTQAHKQVQTAQKAQRAAEQAMAGDQKAVAQLAAMGYMSGGANPTLQILGSGDPGAFLSQAAQVEEVNNNAGERVSNLQNEQTAAQRAQVTAEEEIANSQQIQSEMNGKKATIDSEMQVLQSSAMQQAMKQFADTGTPPPAAVFSFPDENNIEVTALKAALTKIGDWYLWGAAGPGEFDCSGLVLWAYAQEGISVQHYTGDLWDDGTHVPFNDLQPGDLVFFFADEDHVGFYLGTYQGTPYFLDAPATGQRVQIQPMEMGSYDGAVRLS